MTVVQGNGLNRLNNQLLPVAYLAVAALVEDLNDRGLLATTQVLELTEFGRAPQIDRPGPLTPP